MRTKILLLFFVFSFLFRTDHSFNQDLGRHLKLGEIILQTKSVPLINLFSYTYPDYPFINSHWLFEVLAYLGQQTIGLQAILVLKVIIFLLAVWLILSIIPKNQYLLLPIGFIFLHTLRERLELRPEIFSFLFTAFTLYILDKYDKMSLRGLKAAVSLAREKDSLPSLGLNPGYPRFAIKNRLIFLLPAVQLIWVNTHIYFIVGLILQAIYLTHLGYQYLRSHMESGKLKLAAVIFVLSSLASLINPSGLKGFLNPFLYGTNYGYTIVENQTMFLLESINFKDPNFLFVKMAVAITLLSIVVALFKKRLLIKNLSLAGFGLALALMNVRSFPYLVFISLPAVLENFGITKFTLLHKLFIVITVPLLAFESFFYLNGDYYKYTDSDDRPKLEFKESGKNALDFVLTNDLPQPIFNNFDIGSYITYRGWPKYRVFVDGRPGEYPKEFFQQIYIPVQQDPQKFKELNQTIGFKTIIFSHTDQTPWGKTFLASIVKDSNWKTIYLDDFMIILASQGVSLKDTPLDLAQLDPANYSFDSYLSYLRLSLFLAQTGNIEPAQKFAERGLSLFPKSPLGNALFGINTPSKFFW